MKAQIKAWGNSQGIRLSKELLEYVGLHCDDYVNIEVADGNIILSKAIRHRTLEERAAAFQNTLGPYQDYDWDDPQGRERW